MKYLFETLIGLIVTLALTIAGFSLNFAYESHAQILLMQNQIIELKDRNKEENEQNEQLKELWKFTTWTFYEVNSIRHSDNLPDTEYPKLN